MNIEVTLEDKPNLKKLFEEDRPAFREILQTCIALAELAADREAAIPWEKLPAMLHPNLTFKDLLFGFAKAIFDVKELAPDKFDILGADLHPLALFKAADAVGSMKYPKWKEHFRMEPDAEVGEEAITDIVRTLLYYARYIDVKQFGKALLSQSYEVFKALPELNAERLPFVPALRYQQNAFGDLRVGNFWKDIGAFYGATTSEPYEYCPACEVGKMEMIGEYQVCPNCNLGVHVVQD